MAAKRVIKVHSDSAELLVIVEVVCEWLSENCGQAFSPLTQVLQLKLQALKMLTAAKYSYLVLQARKREFGPSFNSYEIRIS